MRVESGAAVVRVHVEGILGETGDVRAGDLAAEGEDESIIRKSELPACGRDCDGLLRQVDACDLSLHALNSDRDENVVERDADLSEIGLVVAHTDVVEPIAVHDGDLRGLRAVSELVELASRANRAPQAGEAPAEHDDSLDAHHLDSFSFTAARIRAFNAFSLILSPSWKSMARLVLPARLELNKPDGSAS